MTNITLSLPNEVHDKMKMHKEIRWSEVVRRAITDYVEKLEEKGSDMTTKKLLEELGDDFRKTLNELSFEKAEKEYKKMKDAEWKRVSTIQTG
ncbi:MAG: hypothetical protein J5U17_04960 [Candidatus Methanoperedens sp.]|nr:hypothetical protein [Candidatus Methanoperedens sp.]